MVLTDQRFLYNPTVSVQPKLFKNTNFIKGGATENFEFIINDDTQAYYSCSSLLNGELYVFGGYSATNNLKKQVH